MLAPWRSPLARALHRNRSLAYARYLQLATVRPDGRPANRTVVFRGFWADTNQLKFVTDARSEKVEQIGAQAWGEICWYFPNTREQFRLSGSLQLIQQNEPDDRWQQARIAAWQELSEAARIQFAWATPGQVRDPQDRFEPPVPNSQIPLPHFCLLLMQPEWVDHLELRGNPQNRWRYAWDGTTWSTTEINP